MKPDSCKELKQANPYKLTMEPFKGDKYTYSLEGQGMDPLSFQFFRCSGLASGSLG